MSLFGDAEIVLLCNVANSPFAWMPRVVRKTYCAQCRRTRSKAAGKWNFLGSGFCICASCFLLTPLRELVTDARAIQDYYWHRTGENQK